MALSQYARRKLTHGLKSTSIGDEVADVIDAGSGTLSDAARERIEAGVANRATGDGIADAIDAGTALDGRELNLLATMLGDRTVAQEIQDELSA